jgi:hypothetical protein
MLEKKDIIELYTHIQIWLFSLTRGKIRQGIEIDFYEM